VKKVFDFIKKEFLEMLPPTLFFLVVFCLIVFTHDLMYAQSDVGMLSYAAALIGALVIGKSVLVADALPVWNIFDRQSRLVLIIGRTITYAIVALLFQFLEEFIPLVSGGGSIAAGLKMLPEEIHWPRFWGIHIQLIVFLMLYNIIAVLAEEIGRERFMRLLLGKAGRET
jgi:hypothetical protein